MRSADVLKLELYAFLFVSLSVCFAADKPLAGNLHVMQQQLEQMISECSNSISATGSQSVILHALAAKHPLNGLVQHQIYTWLKQQGFTSVFVDSSQDMSSAGYLISFLPVSATVRYHKINSHKKNRQRQITMELHVCVQDSAREILLSTIKTAVFQDSVSQKDIRYLETRDLVFTHGQQPEENLAARFFQPLLISLTTAGIIYSFYSFRSK